jgi:hypothetical protein
LGLRPKALAITVYRFEGGQWNNVMPSSQSFKVTSPETTTQADITIFRLFAGDYRVDLDASYAIFSLSPFHWGSKRRFTFERTAFV